MSSVIWKLLATTQWTLSVIVCVVCMLEVMTVTMNESHIYFASVNLVIYKEKIMIKS